MRHFLFALLISLTCVQANAFSVDPKFNAHDLSISWEVIENNKPANGQSLNALTITNNGKNTLPANGWKLYFNSARMIMAATPTGNARIDFINFGDLLFGLVPINTFPELKPGASVRVEFVAEDLVVNTTDGPEGFYLVWDNQPDKGFNIGEFTYKPFKPNYPGLITPEIIYNQNKSITDVPESQLTKVFPTPVSYKETGGYFIYTSKTHFKADPKFQKELNNFRYIPRSWRSEIYLIHQQLSLLTTNQICERKDMN